MRKDDFSTIFVIPDLWILSRTKTMEEADYRHLLDKAKENGFDISKLMLVEQNCP